MFRLACLLLAISAMAASEATLRPVGVIGNTGEQGSALVRLTPDHSYRGHVNAVGCGVVLDRLGTLWTRMDDAFVSRLSLDGRQLGRFPSPKSSSGYDTIVILGDQILLLANGELSALPIDAAPGAAFKPLGLKLRALAHTPVKGRLAAITAAGGIIWVKADGSQGETVAQLPHAWLIEADGTGSLFIGTRDNPQQAGDGWMRKFVGGTEVTSKGWPKPWDLVHPGIATVPSFLQWDDGMFFVGGGGHVSALDANLDPAPGTVLGMQGKTVIGIGADWRQELGCARGIVRIRAGSYAIGGSWGQPFFAEWPDPTRSMHLLSWFTGRSACSALNLDADGNVYVDRLMYAWSATPDSFPTATEGGASIVSQIVRAGPRLLLRQDRWNHGDSWALPLYSGTQLQNNDWLSTEKVPKDWWDRAQTRVGRPDGFSAVAYPDGDGFTLICLADASGGRVMQLHANGRFRAAGTATAFRTAQPGKELTSLAMRDEKTLLAAIDGQVVELTRAGEDWQEQRRWNSWGKADGEHFGARIRLTCDQGRLLVADSDRQRVLWFAAAGGRPKTQFGRTDAAGNDLQSLDGPGMIAVCGDRAVVHDSGNQRLVKLELAE